MLRSRLKNIINKSKELSNPIGAFDLFKKSLPIEVDDNYRLESAWKAYGSPKNYKEALWNGMIQPIDETNVKLPSIGYNEETDEYEYLNKGRENETVNKDIRVWDNDVIPLVKELKQGGFIRVYDEEKDCWKYSKNKSQETLTESREVIEEFKSGGKKKIRIRTHEDTYIELESLTEDLKKGRTPVGKNSKGLDLYLGGDGIAAPLNHTPGKMENGGIIDSFLKGGKSENNEKEQVPSDIFELIDGDYYYWPDDDRALDFIKNNKWFRKKYKQWEEPKDGEKARLVTKKKLEDLWFEKNKEQIFKSLVDIPHPSGGLTPTGEYAPDGLELYDDGTGNLYTLQPQAFKQGGQMNVIPEGALHARKNNMEGAGEDFTAKGIPVIDNSGELQAEIERNEIIFTKEVTNKIEEAYKKFNSEDISNSEKDELAIKIGKFLTKLILENTEDNTGLILEVELKM